MDDTNNEDNEEEISSADNDLVISKVGTYIYFKRMNEENLKKKKNF